MNFRNIVDILQCTNLIKLLLKLKFDFKYIEFFKIAKLEFEILSFVTNQLNLSESRITFRMIRAFCFKIEKGRNVDKRYYFLWASSLTNLLINISLDILSNQGCYPRLESHYISGWADVRANVLLSAPIIEGRATSVMRSGLIQECQNIC